MHSLLKLTQNYILDILKTKTRLLQQLKKKKSVQFNTDQKETFYTFF